MNKDIVNVGDTVIIYNNDNEKIWELKIISSQISYTPQLGSGFLKNSIQYKAEVKEFSNIENNEISENAPIAKALLGKKKKETFSYTCPDGEKIFGTILDIK
jgi:transcription elongation GreA/GreB family factor